MIVDELINKFRTASRELFNNYFRMEDCWGHDGEAWDLENRFSVVQKELFAMLVSETLDCATVEYGQRQPHLRLRVKHETAEIMVNREESSGYWDFPIDKATKEAVFSFICFFDWDNLGLRDNQYVRAEITDWPSHPEAIGKHALLNANDVRFEVAES